MVSESLPSRKYSALTVGLAWPRSSASDHYAQAESHRSDARDAHDAAQDTRNVAERFADLTSGRFSGAMYYGYLDDAKVQDSLGDFLDLLARSTESVADEILHVKDRLDGIDAQAHEDIEALEAAGPVVESARAAIIHVAAAEAWSHATGAAAVIGRHTATIEAFELAQPKHGSAPPSGSPGRAYQESPKVDRPGQVSPMSNDHGKGDAPGRGDNDRKTAESGDNPGKDAMEKNPSRDAGSSATSGDDPGRASNKPEHGGSAERLGGGATSPLSGGGLPSGGAPGGGGSPGGLGSGLAGGGSPLSAFESGLRGAGGSSGGLPGAGVGRGVPAGGGAPGGGVGRPLGADFARGFNAGSGGVVPPAALASPPPSAAPAQVAPVSPVPAAGSVASPAAGSSVPPLSGVPGALPPAAAGSPGVGSGVPSAAGLAPVGSDAVRHGGSVTPVSASGSGPSAGGAVTAGAGSVAGGAATASMAAGTLGSPAAAGGRKGEGSRDPLLEAAAALCFRLMHSSRFYPGLDWCVGVFRGAGGVVETVVTSSEGAGYVPAGVFLPRSARLLFADSLVDNEFRNHWFGNVDPVATMVAYAQLRAADASLYAVAASSLLGGGVAAAEAAGVEHVRLCRSDDSPLSAADGDQVLDDLHVHRLGLVDPVLLSWLEDGDRTLAEVTQRADALTTDAFYAVSATLGLDASVEIPLVGAAVFNALTLSELVEDDRWEELFGEVVTAQYEAGSLRPSADSVLDPMLYRRRHDLARLLELLMWWRPVSGAGSDSDGAIRFVEIAYCAQQILGEVLGGGGARGR